MSAEFCDAMRAAGLEPPADIEPGKFHRFPGFDKRSGNTAAWCRLFDDARGGIFGDWSTGLSETWQAKREQDFTTAERAAFKRQIEESRAQAKADRKASQATAAVRAAEIWEAAPPAPADHSYLLKKKMVPGGLRTKECIG